MVFDWHSKCNDADGTRSRWIGRLLSRSEVHFDDHECCVEIEEMQMSNNFLCGRTEMQMFFYMQYNTYTCQDWRAICILTIERRCVALCFKYTL